MIREVRDPTIINRFANHPEIRPGLGGIGILDLSGGLNEHNVFLCGEHGVICWGWTAPRTYEVHVFFTRAGRGRWGVRACRKAIEFIACKGAEHLWARVHPDRPEIALLARLNGFAETGEHHTLDLGDGPVCWRIFNRRL